MAKKTGHSEHNLRQRRAGRYQFAIAIPRDLQADYGKRAIEKKLETDDLTVARVRREKLLGDYRKEFAKLRATKAVKSGELHKISKADLARLSHAEMQRFHAELAAKPWSTETEKDLALFQQTEAGDEELVAKLRAAGIAPTTQAVNLFKEARSDALYGAYKLDAKGAPVPKLETKTPLREHKTTWLNGRSRKGSPFRAKTRAEFERSLDGFAEWMEGRGLTHVEAVTPAVAREYSNHLRAKVIVREGVSRLLAPASINKTLTALSSYWKFLGIDGVVDSSPWSGKWAPVIKKPMGERERPYTDAELIKLFEAADMTDDSRAMALALMSGGRREENYTQTKSNIDFDTGTMFLPGEKNEAAPRVIPIHSLLLPVLRKLCAGDGYNGYLLPRLTDPKEKDMWKPGGKTPRGDAPGKRFISFRRSVLGKDPTLDWHSFRRTFDTLLGRARAQPYELNRLMGHAKAGSQSEDSAYMQLPDDALRTVVESIVLPERVVAVMKRLAE